MCVERFCGIPPEQSYLNRFIVNLLVVEDDPSMVDLIKVLLAQSTLAEYHITTVDTAERAIAVIDQSRFQLVLVDYHLEGSMTGIDVIKSLLSESRFVPMVLMTGDTSEQLDFEAISVGAAGFINKQDLSRSVLDRTIRYALSRAEQIRALEDETNTHKKLSMSDPLTGLPNRREFEQRLNAAIQKAESDKSEFALVFIDLDGFKMVNDRYGHDVGDQVLRAIASRLVGDFRHRDSLCRIGGDEFVALITSDGDALPLNILGAQLVTRLKARIVREIVIGQHRIVQRASFGFAEYPKHGTSASELLKMADTYMYREKKASNKSIDLTVS